LPKGIPRTDEERTERHESIYGEGSTPPEERRGLGGGGGYNLTQMIIAFAAGAILGFLIAGR
jgi:hypothetical protein